MSTTSRITLSNEWPYELAFIYGMFLYPLFTIADPPSRYVIGLVGQAFVVAWVYKVTYNFYTNLGRLALGFLSVLIVFLLPVHLIFFVAVSFLSPCLVLFQYYFWKAREEKISHKKTN